MSTGRTDTLPRLIADIGGTNARFGLEVDGELTRIEVLPCREYPTLEAAMRSYLARNDAKPAHAAIGIANPVTGDEIKMTNHHWAFSIEATRQALGLSTLLVLNDFTVLALSLPHLPKQELVQVGGGKAQANAAIALLGAGTGLGVSGLIPTRDGHMLPLAGEGGHASFSPCNDKEAAVWQYAYKKLGHVSLERFLSGPGLELIYEALCALSGNQTTLSAAAISERGLANSDPRARETLDLFCAMLGTAAANLALTLGAFGGVYIGGGIVPKLGDYFVNSPFRTRFEEKGRFASYLARIPVYVIHSAWPGMIGASAALAEHLAS
jgi:glucokinase